MLFSLFLFAVMEKLLTLEDYANDISLYEPYQRYTGDYKSEDEMASELSELMYLIITQCGFYKKYNFNPQNFEDVFYYIRGFLNKREPNELPPKVNELINHALSHRLVNSNVTNAKTLSHVTGKNVQNKNNIFLWRGDISLLDVDAIVNAANSQMLGCFRPFHNCIDNIIHSYAGPQLRNDCATIMNKQGFEEPTGNAKITRAYNLPSRFVLHTVGPIYNSTQDQECRVLLANCYKSCLEVASQVESIRSVAFCCISTGVFQFPQVDAAQIAVKTVDEWLSQHPGRFDQIVFNVFTEKDLQIYTELLYDQEL